MLVLAAALVSQGCGAAHGTLPSSDNPLSLLATSPVWQERDLFERISRSPHHYFRFVNTAFAREVCRRFEPVLPVFPIVNLHGDAHLEQVAATADGIGLEDFDDSTSGPPVIDLVRFGASIELALRAREWAARSDEAWSRFVAAYRLGLEDAVDGAPTPEPAVAARLRAQFEGAEAFLQHADARMEPVPDAERADVEEGYGRYAALVLRIQPGWDPARMRLKRWGKLSSGGIGSAATDRYLLRVEGESPAPEDDVVLQAKRLGDLGEIPCVVSQRGDALRVVAGAASFGQRSDPFLAIVPRRSGESLEHQPWWVQSWNPNHAGIEIGTLESVDELVSIAELAGYQMARGHTSVLPPPYDRQLRELVKAMLAEEERAIRTAVLDLADLTVGAHRDLLSREPSR